MSLWTVRFLVGTYQLNPRTSALLLLLIASDIDPIQGKEYCWNCDKYFFKIKTHTVLIKNSSTLEDLILPLLPAFQGLFEIPCSVAATSDSETISFESIQLSTQGAERQAKDATWEKMVCTDIALWLLV